MKATEQSVCKELKEFLSDGGSHLCRDKKHGKNDRTERTGKLFHHSYRGNCILVVDLIDGTFTMRTCGWYTVTTKSRLNALLSELGKGYICQRDYEWYYVNGDGVECPFSDVVGKALPL